MIAIIIDLTRYLILSLIPLLLVLLLLLLLLLLLIIIIIIIIITIIIIIIITLTYLCDHHDESINYSYHSYYLLLSSWLLSYHYNDVCII